MNIQDFLNLMKDLEKPVTLGADRDSYTEIQIKIKDLERIKNMLNQNKKSIINNEILKTLEDSKRLSEANPYAKDFEKIIKENKHLQSNLKYLIDEAKGRAK